MEGGEVFVLAPPSQPGGPLARYRAPEMGRVAGEVVACLTSPGDLVVDLFCRGSAMVREVVQGGRRAVGLSVNPVALLIASLDLRPPQDPQALSAALTRLGDVPKGDRPLRLRIAALYRTACPTCGATGTAEWFAWDREARYPYAKLVRCPRCAEAQEGPTDEEDIAAARRFDPRGLPYHYALGRVLPPEHPARSRAAELVDLYTPRNLSALMDVAMRIEGIEVDPPVRAALQAVLLEGFDRGSGLDPHGEVRPRPRVLRLPTRFLERNVWFVLEQALEERLALLAEPRPPLPRASSLADLLSDPHPAYILLPSPARHAGRRLPPGSVALLLADPPRPDGVFWALCALWSGWLWDGPIAKAMRPYLQRRRFDWEWHRRALQAAFKAVAPLLAPGGALVTLFVERDEGMVASVCLAAAGAGYDLSTWGVDPHTGCYLVWRWSGRTPRAVEPEALAHGLAAGAEMLARSCLRDRAEPTHRSVLRTTVYAGLAAGGHLAVMEAPAEGDEKTEAHGRTPLRLHVALQAIEQGLERVGAEWDEEAERLWLPALPPGGPDPLADRVEEAVWEILCERRTWSAADLLRSVYGRFVGSLTPDWDLVMACILSLIHI